MALGSIGGKRRFSTNITSATLTATSDELLTVIGPAKIYRLGIHATAAKTTGTAFVLTVQSVAGTTETALGTATSPDTFAVGATLVKEFNPPLVVAAGALGQIEISTAGGGGSPTAIVWVDATEEPLTKTYLDSIVALT
jgi:hypothetical protein